MLLLQLLVFVSCTQSSMCTLFAVVLCLLQQVREDTVLCQAVSALVTAFSRKLRLIQQYMLKHDGSRLLQQYAACGFLVGRSRQQPHLGGLPHCSSPHPGFMLMCMPCGPQFSVESLLSTAGKELGMLGDFDVGVKMLSKFAFRLLPPRRVRSTRGGRRSSMPNAMGAGAGAGSGSPMRGSAAAAAAASGGGGGGGGHVRIHRGARGLTVVEIRMWPVRQHHSNHHHHSHSAQQRHRRRSSAAASPSSAAATAAAAAVNAAGAGGSTVPRPGVPSTGIALPGTLKLRRSVTEQGPRAGAGEGAGAAAQQVAADPQLPPQAIPGGGLKRRSVSEQGGIARSGQQRARSVRIRGSVNLHSSSSGGGGGAGGGAGVAGPGGDEGATATPPMDAGADGAGQEEEEEHEDSAAVAAAESSSKAGSVGSATEEDKAATAKVDKVNDVEEVEEVVEAGQESAGISSSDTSTDDSSSDDSDSSSGTSTPSAVQEEATASPYPLQSAAAAIAAANDTHAPRSRSPAVRVHELGVAMDPEEEEEAAAQARVDDVVVDVGVDSGAVSGGGAGAGAGAGAATNGHRGLDHVTERGRSVSTPPLLMSPSSTATGRTARSGFSGGAGGGGGGGGGGGPSRGAGGSRSGARGRSQFEVWPTELQRLVPQSLREGQLIRVVPVLFTQVRPSPVVASLAILSCANPLLCLRANCPPSCTGHQRDADCGKLQHHVRLAKPANRDQPREPDGAAELRGALQAARDPGGARVQPGTRLDAGRCTLVEYH